MATLAIPHRDYKTSRCVYCGAKLYTNSPYSWRRCGTKDHVIPKSCGASAMNGNNIVYACQGCNREKANYNIVYYHYAFFVQQGYEFYSIDEVYTCIFRSVRFYKDAYEYYAWLAGYYADKCPDDIIRQYILKVMKWIAEKKSSAQTA